MTYYYDFQGIYMLGDLKPCSDDKGYTTLRVETYQENKLYALVEEVFYQLAEQGFQLDHWVTHKYPFEGNRLQKRFFYRELVARSPEYSEELVDWPGCEGIPCKLYRLALPYSSVHLHSRFAFDSGLLIIHRDPMLTLKSLSEYMRPYATGINCRSLVAICLQHPQWIVSSLGYGNGFYLWQFVGITDNVQVLRAILQSWGCREVP